MGAHADNISCKARVEPPHAELVQYRDEDRAFAMQGWSAVCVRDHEIVELRSELAIAARKCGHLFGVAF